jgi:hypothetical protein
MYSSTHSLASALDGGEWSASRPGRFTPRERAPGTHWIVGWVGLRAVLDAVVKRKIPSLRRVSNPRTPIFQPAAQRYTDWAITAHWGNYKVILKANDELCVAESFRNINKLECQKGKQKMWRTVLWVWTEAPGAEGLGRIKICSISYFWEDEESWRDADEMGGRGERKEIR